MNLLAIFCWIPGARYICCLPLTWEELTNGQSNLSRLACYAIALLLALASAGCGKSKSDASGGSADAGGTSGAPSGLEGEAQAAVFAEIARHCVKGPDGWTTANVQGVAIAPERFLRQFHEIVVDHISADELGDSNRLNGTEWKGWVVFKPVPCREAGDSGMALGGLAGFSRQRGQWTQWYDYTVEPLAATKTKGKWTVFPDSMLTRGELPTPQDYANAGVQ